MPDKPEPKKKKKIVYTVRLARSVMDELVEEIKSRKGHPEMPTGIPSLDELIWGIHRKEVQVFAARTSNGKTTMVLQIATHLASQKKNVLFISLEMTNDQVMERVLCNYSGISGWDLRRGILPSDFDERVSQFRQVVDGLDLFLVDNMGSSFDQLRSIFTSMEMAKTKPDVIVIDYINLISPGDDQDDRGAIKEYIRELKEFAKHYNIAVIVVAQVNREAMKQKDSTPQIHNMKETGALEEVADTVCLLHWKRDTEDAEADGEFRVIVGKARHGPQGVVQLRFNAEHYRFEDVPVPVERNSNGSEPVRMTGEPLSIGQLSPLSGIEASQPRETDQEIPF